MRAIKYRNKIVGWVKANKFIKEVNANHFFRKYQGFAISESVLRQLELKRINQIIIKYRGRTKLFTYQSSVPKYLNSDIIHFNEDDKQRVMPIRKMMLIGTEDLPDEDE